MRSRIVPKEDLIKKFGTETKSFPYAFIIAKRFPGWDAPHSEIYSFQKPLLIQSKFSKNIELKIRNTP